MTFVSDVGQVTVPRNEVVGGRRLVDGKRNAGVGRAGF